MKLISVTAIIPAFNAAKYLAEAIESVLSQTPKPYEIIVVDDGSTDETVRVANSFIPHIKLIRQKNMGAAAARNVAVKMARSEYLAFLDADDLWTSVKLKDQLLYLQTHPEKDMVYGMVEQFISPELPDEHKNKLRVELKTMPAYVAGGMLITKQNFLRVGLFNENLEVGEFIDWFSRAKDLGLSYHVENKVTLKRRIHTTNMGISKKHNLKDYTFLLRESLARKRKAGMNPI